MERASWSDIPTGTFAGVGKSAIAPHGPVRASLLPSSLLSNPLRSLRLRGSIQSSIIHIQRVQTLKMERQAREETSVIFGFLGRPYHLGKRDQARVGHVFGDLGGGMYSVQSWADAPSMCFAVARVNPAATGS